MLIGYRIKRFYVLKGIAGLRDLSVNVHIAGHLKFNWNGRSRRRGAASQDRVYVAIYCEHLNLWLTRLGSAYRKDSSFILDAEPFIGFLGHFNVNEKRVESCPKTITIRIIATSVKVVRMEVH